MELYDTEEQQVEAIKDWWKENGKAVALGAVVGLGGIFGWRYYQDMQVSAQDAASQAYTSALTTLQAQGAGGIEATQNFIDANGDSQYSVLAALQLAKAQVDDGDFDAALNQLEWAKNNSKDEAILPVITFRIARLLAEQENYDKAFSELDAIASADWAGRIAELRGDILLRQGDAEGAYTAYTEAQQQTDASQMLKVKLDDLAK
ncbi:YfgM family protein [Vibrio tapetis]|uniref:Ancillary SecYEG translocon subunit n=1 Tax=Vibrio tapetis subsp. tapetis TaxID=1671868 RepID=A0A2N8ZEW6_9VIBR|nr:YfgM family protein [Vibrio tapetis]SON50457.1 Membrane protein [Vibrio tapetis subsp. tapetis]